MWLGRTASSTSFLFLTSSWFIPKLWMLLPVLIAIEPSKPKITPSRNVLSCFLLPQGSTQAIVGMTVGVSVGLIEVELVKLAIISSIVGLAGLRPPRPPATRAINPRARLPEVRLAAFKAQLPSGRSYFKLPHDVPRGESWGCGEHRRAGNNHCVAHWAETVEPRVEPAALRWLLQT